MCSRKGIVIVCVIVTGIFAFRWLEAGEEPAAKAVSPITLKELLERVKKLETRVEQLEGRPRTLLSPGANIRWLAPKSPLMAVPEAPLPEGWQQREINGIRYYLVPLDSASGIEAKSSQEYR